jgi:hypothetical protein
MPEQENIVNSVLLQGARIECTLSGSLFWDMFQGEGQKMTVCGILGEEVTFFKKDLIGFIDRKNFKVPEALAQLNRTANAADKPAIITPRSAIGRSY